MPAAMRAGGDLAVAGAGGLRLPPREGAVLAVGEPGDGVVERSVHGVHPAREL